MLSLEVDEERSPRGKREVRERDGDIKGVINQVGGWYLKTSWLLPGLYNPALFPFFLAKKSDSCDSCSPASPLRVIKVSSFVRSYRDAESVCITVGWGGCIKAVHLTTVVSWIIDFCFLLSIVIAVEFTVVVMLIIISVVSIWPEAFIPNPSRVTM